MIPVYISYDMTDGPPFHIALPFLDAIVFFLSGLRGDSIGWSIRQGFLPFRSPHHTMQNTDKNSDLETRGAETGIRCIVAKILGSGFSIRLSDGKRGSSLV